MAFGAEKRRKT
jgi:hypothetical protein